MTGRLAALPTLSLAREDVLLLRRLLAQNKSARLSLNVANRIGGAFEATNVVGSTAYVERHRDEMDRTVAALVMDIGAGRPAGWFSMGRTDLGESIRALAAPLSQCGEFAIEHAAFAATDNAPFMAEGVPNLILIQDETPYFPVHHTIADTPDKIDARDFASSVTALAATAYAIADARPRFGRRLTPEEVKRMADETKVGERWRAAGIWK